MFDMKLEEPNCPSCGQPAVFVMESQVMYSEICISGDDGQAKYTGYTENNGEPDHVLEEDGRAVVCCQEGHTWHTFIE